MPSAPAPAILRSQVSSPGIEKLNELLDHRCEGVIMRYSLDKKVSYEEAEKVFVGLMQYVIATTFTAGYRTPSMIIDEMWHIYLLHMRDYEQFCADMLGSTLYHDPALDDGAFAHYPETRAIAAELCGELDCSVWPLEHDPHPEARCVSSGFTETPLFI